MDSDSSPSPRLRPFAVLPSLVTLGNLACGLSALVWITEAAEPGMHHRLAYAGWLLVLAAFLDGVDGKVARLTRSTSELGAQLDSLCDAVTFGVAPAMLGRALVVLEGPAFEVYVHPRLLFVAPVVYGMCAILRLARYNVSHNEEGPGAGGNRGFTGLPTPAAAAVPTALVLFFHGIQDPDFLLGWAPDTVATAQALVIRAVPFSLVVLAALMVSRISYPHFFSWLTERRRPFHVMAEAVVLLGLLLVEPELTLLGASLLFVLLPAGLALRRWLPGAGRPASRQAPR